MEDQIFDFCRQAYNEVFHQASTEFLVGKTLSKANIEEAERYAQKLAIRTALTIGVEQFPSSNVADVWKEVYKVHIFRKSGIAVDEETISKVISADNSWKKSSGHAFEEYIKEIGNVALADTNIRILLQKDLNILLKDGKISNIKNDIKWLEEQVASSVFDLYAIFTEQNRNYCFGCIQSKTSVRDRTTRDRELSSHAMENFFWSACVTLDGAYLKMPKFNAMVNGGSTEFVDNGWHGMYVLSTIETDDRMYQTNYNLDVFAEHAKIAAHYWKTQRQLLSKKWRAEYDEI